MFGKKEVPATSAGSLQQWEARPSSQLRFEIRRRPIKMLLATAFFGICSLVLVGLLLDPRGVTINRSIPLGPLGADIFFDILMISSLALT